MMKKRISDLNLIFSTPVWTSIIANHKQVNEKMFSYIKSIFIHNIEFIRYHNRLGEGETFGF